MEGHERYSTAPGVSPKLEIVGAARIVQVALTIAANEAPPRALEIIVTGVFEADAPAVLAWLEQMRPKLRNGHELRLLKATKLAMLRLDMNEGGSLLTYTIRP